MACVQVSQGNIFPVQIPLGKAGGTLPVILRTGRDDLVNAGPLAPTANCTGMTSLMVALACASRWRKCAPNRCRSRCKDSLKADANSTYVKVCVGQIRWAGDCGAVVSLTGVDDYSNSGLPDQFLAFLDSAQAEAYQQVLYPAAFGAGFSDDHLCDVRVHGLSFPFGELVMRPVPLDLDKGNKDLGDSEPKLLSDVMDLRESRLPCSVGEALAASEQLRVPALVCLAYLLRTAKTCLDKALLKGAFCEQDDQECALEMYELSDKLKRWTVEADQGTADAAEGGQLLRDLNAFAWCWLFSQSSLSEELCDWESEFRQYQRLHSQFPF